MALPIAALRFLDLVPRLILLCRQAQCFPQHARHQFFERWWRCLRDPAPLEFLPHIIGNVNRLHEIKRAANVPVNRPEYGFSKSIVDRKSLLDSLPTAKFNRAVLPLDHPAMFLWGPEPDLNRRLRFVSVITSPDSVFPQLSFRVKILD